MALTKATIKNLDTDEEIEVLFNPKEYVIEKRTPWKEQVVNTYDHPPVEFTVGERKRLSMELFFDTSEEKKDVRELTDKIEELMMINSDTHMPPILLFTWGSLSFRCVLEDLVQRFTMFMNDGTPLRAILKVMFKEYATAAEQREDKPLHSSDHTKMMVMREGDSLSAMSAREYNDAGKWREIADANGIEDPMNVKPGTVVKLPPLY